MPTYTNKMNNKKNPAPTVDVRSKLIGIGVVDELTTKRAVLTNTPGDHTILITPHDSYNDDSIDLTEKLQPRTKVAYKAVWTENSGEAVAIYVRPVSECHVGRASIVDIRPTLGYAKSSKLSDIFFCVSALHERILSEPFCRRTRDISKIMRVGDPITYVAVHDSSTAGRAAYALEVQFGFNQEEGGLMLGIIVDVSPTTCTVWAKNFPILRLENDQDFGLDSSGDMRQVFVEGDRVTFRATLIGCGIGGVSNVRALDKPKMEKLARMQLAARKSASERSAAISSSSINGTSPIGAVAAATTASMSNSASSIAQSSMFQPKFTTPSPLDSELANLLEDELNLDDLEAELDANVDVGYESKPIDQYRATTSSDFHDSFYTAATSMVEKPKCVDVGVQVSNLIEAEVVGTLLQDSDIFTMACQRFPKLVHDVMKLRRHF